MYLNSTLVQRKADLDKEITLIKKELNRLPEEGALILNHSKGVILCGVISTSGPRKP